LRLAGAVSHDGSTLLHDAARTRDIALARRLILRGVAINALMTTSVWRHIIDIICYTVSPNSESNQ
jgi:hypothetical protein